MPERSENKPPKLTRSKDKRRESREEPPREINTTKDSPTSSSDPKLPEPKRSLPTPMPEERKKRNECPYIIYF